MEGFNCFEKNSQCVPQDVPNSIKLFFSPYALAKVELSYIYNYNNKISAKGKHLYASRVCGMRPIKVAPYKSIPLGALIDRRRNHGYPLDIAREEVGRYLCFARGSSFSVLEYSNSLVLESYMVLEPWMLGKLLIILDEFLFIFGYLKNISKHLIAQQTSIKKIQEMCSH
jgi:hypothetical protein